MGYPIMRSLFLFIDARVKYELFFHLLRHFGILLYVVFAHGQRPRNITEQKKVCQYIATDTPILSFFCVFPVV